MRVLLDNCVDIRLHALVVSHEVAYTVEMGWAHLSNGVLLANARTLDSTSLFP